MNNNNNIAGGGLKGKPQLTHGRAKGDSEHECCGNEVDPINKFKSNVLHNISNNGDGWGDEWVGLHK
jgi:hypothetical protein